MMWVGMAGVGIGGGGWWWYYVNSAEERQRRDQRRQEEERYETYQRQRAAKAYIEPKEYWTVEELAQYDGTTRSSTPTTTTEPEDDEGPILIAADGIVFNVWKGRHFYGPGGEYHLFAGRDATRFLAKTIVEEETPEAAAMPLTMGERAALAAWMFTFKNKYEVVGKLKGFDPSTTSMKSLL
jgi:membrane-associated progesterone receptor component